MCNHTMLSSLTIKEHFNLHGSLPTATIEQLVDDLADRGPVNEAAEAATVYMGEASGQFPAEDFLSAVTGKLQDLAKRLRGNNKAELLGIIESMDDIAQTTFNAADYGREQLGLAKTELEKLTD